MFNNSKGDFYDESKTAGITVVDTVGKYHFYKFSQLLKKFGVKTWCIYDGDKDECSRSISHKLLNQNIEELKINKVIEDSLRIDPNLEEFLGLKKDYQGADIGLYVNLENNTDNCTKGANYKKIVDFVKKIIEV